MRRKRRQAGEAAGVNLTPMLSVVVLLLLFFIATAPVMQVRGFIVSGNGSHLYFDCTIVIAVDGQNRIFINQGGEPGQVNIRAVRTILARKLLKEPNCQVLVQADRHSDMGTVLRVADRAKLARDPPPPVTIATTDD